MDHGDGAPALRRCARPRVRGRGAQTTSRLHRATRAPGNETGPLHVGDEGAPPGPAARPTVEPDRSRVRRGWRDQTRHLVGMPAPGRSLPGSRGIPSGFAGVGGRTLRLGPTTSVVTGRTILRPARRHKGRGRVLGEHLTVHTLSTAWCWAFVRRPHDVHTPVPRSVHRGLLSGRRPGRRGRPQPAADTDRRASSVNTARPRAGSYPWISLTSSLVMKSRIAGLTTCPGTRMGKPGG